MNLWHKNKWALRTKASVAPYRSLREFGVLLKIINLVTYSSLLLFGFCCVLFFLFFFFFYCHWLPILPSRSWGGWSVMRALPAASRMLCSGQSDCRVCLGFSPPAWCWWESCSPAACGQHRTPHRSVAKKGLPLHSVACTWPGRQGQGLCLCCCPLGCCLDL